LRIRGAPLLSLVERESNNDLLLIGSRNLGSHVADRGLADAVMISNAMLFIDLRGVPNAACMTGSGFVQIVGAKSKPRVLFRAESLARSMQMKTNPPVAPGRLMRKVHIICRYRLVVNINCGQFLDWINRPAVLLFLGPENFDVPPLMNG
jgi:hypothetical protein